MFIEKDLFHIHFSQMIDFSAIFDIMDQDNDGLLDFSEFVLGIIFKQSDMKVRYPLMFDL